MCSDIVADGMRFANALVENMILMLPSHVEAFREVVKNRFIARMQQQQQQPSSPARQKKRREDVIVLDESSSSSSISEEEEEEDEEEEEEKKRVKKNEEKEEEIIILEDYLDDDVIKGRKATQKQIDDTRVFCAAICRDGVEDGLKWSHPDHFAKTQAARDELITTNRWDTIVRDCLKGTTTEFTPYVWDKPLPGGRTKLRKCCFCLNDRVACPDTLYVFGTDPLHPDKHGPNAICASCSETATNIINYYGFLKVLTLCFQNEKTTDEELSRVYFMLEYYIHQL
jgi:hypothetical protein